MKPIIAVPRGSILPTDLGCPVIEEGTFLEKMWANTQEKVAIIVLTTEELITLVEKPHLFGIDVIALVGVPGGRYDAVWSSYVAPLRRVSLDTLAGELARIIAASDPKPDEVAERKSMYSPGLRGDPVTPPGAESEPENFE